MIWAGNHTIYIRNPTLCPLRRVDIFTLLLLLECTGLYLLLRRFMFCFFHFSTPGFLSQLRLEKEKHRLVLTLFRVFFAAFCNSKIQKLNLSLCWSITRLASRKRKHFVLNSCMLMLHIYLVCFKTVSGWKLRFTFHFCRDDFLALVDQKKWFEQSIFFFRFCIF